MYSQVGIGTLKPDASSALEVNVSDLPSDKKKGMLIPRITETERDAIIAPKEGLMVYNTSQNRIEFYNGQKWVALKSN